MSDDEQSGHAVVIGLARRRIADAGGGARNGFALMVILGLSVAPIVMIPRKGV